MRELEYLLLIIRIIQGIVERGEDPTWELIELRKAVTRLIEQEAANQREVDDDSSTENTGRACNYHERLVELVKDAQQEFYAIKERGYIVPVQANLEMWRLRVEELLAELEGKEGT